MRFVLRPLRLVGVVFVIGSILVVLSIAWSLVWRRWGRIRTSNYILRFYCRMMAQVLGLRVRVIDAENLQGMKNALFVGNHLSYTDVLALGGLLPACFVTSTEIKRTPVLGLVCKMSGCLFVERRNKQNIMNEVSELRDGLKEGLNVVIFPEATSTNGEQILRFRRPLFVAAIGAGVPVVPFCLNYRLVGGQPIDLASRDSVFWYGDMDFVPHIWDLCGSGGVDVDLHILPALATASDSDAQELATRSQAAVEAIFLPVR